MPIEHSAGAVIYNKGKYLLLYRKAHGHYREGWLFVRGLLEKNETAEAAVRREIQEETGIKDIFIVKGFREESQWFYSKEGKTVFKTAIYLFAETSTDEVKVSKEHDGYEWLSFHEAYPRLTFDNDRKILRKAHEFIGKMIRE